MVFCSNFFLGHAFFDLPFTPWYVMLSVRRWKSWKQVTFMCWLYRMQTDRSFLRFLICSPQQPLHQCLSIFFQCLRCTASSVVDSPTLMIAFGSCIQWENWRMSGRFTFTTCGFYTPSLCIVQFVGGSLSQQHVRWLRAGFSHGVDNFLPLACTWPPVVRVYQKYFILWRALQNSIKVTLSL